MFLQLKSESEMMII